MQVNIYNPGVILLCCTGVILLCCKLTTVAAADDEMLSFEAQCNPLGPVDVRKLEQVDLLAPRHSDS